MDRRKFLATLAALPLLKHFKAKPKERVNGLGTLYIAPVNPFEIEALVLIADGWPDSTNERIHVDDVSWPEFVSVTDGFDPMKPPLGTAELRKEGDKVYAKLKLRGGVSVGGLYPAIGGSCKIENLDAVTDAKVPRRLIDVSIHQIALSRERNSDVRIPALPADAWKKLGVVTDFSFEAYSDCRVFKYNPSGGNIPWRRS